MRTRQVYLVLAVVIVINQLINFGLLDGMFAWLYGLDSAPPLPILESTFTPIALGVVVAHVMNHPKSFNYAAHWLGRRSAAALLFAIQLTLVAWLPADLSGWPRLSIHVMVALWLTLLVVREDTSFQALQEAKPIAFVGKR